MMFWYENVNERYLRKSRVLDILEEYNIGVMVAMRRMNHDTISILRTLNRRGIHTGLWPLLHDKYGYWINTCNAEQFSELIQGLLSWLEKNHIASDIIAIDVEPSLELVTMLSRKNIPLMKFISYIKRAHSRYYEGVEILNSTIDYLKGHGFRILLVMPDILVEFDTETSKRLCQIFGLPVYDIRYDLASTMTYNSILLKIPGFTHELAIWRMTRILTNAKKIFGNVVPSIGLIWHGKLDNEPIYSEPRQLAIDIATIKYLGFRTTIVYCLEGLIYRKNRKEWVSTTVSTQSRPPKPILRYEILRRLCGKIISSLLKILA